MKAITYRMVLSDGTQIDRPAQNAGEAIEQTRREYRGRTVVACRSGLNEQEAYDLRVNGVDKLAHAGEIIYEIPEHSAYDERVVFAPRKRKSDSSEPMFSDEEIKAESLKAVEKRDREFQVTLANAS